MDVFWGELGHYECDLSETLILIFGEGKNDRKLQQFCKNRIFTIKIRRTGMSLCLFV